MLAQAGPAVQRLSRGFAFAMIGSSLSGR
jgi:hypothetical protein